MNIPKVSIKKILYTTDLSETGRHAFSYAASLSELYGAKLSVMHVVDEEPELDKRLAGYIPKDLWQEIKDRDLEEAKQIILARRRDNALILGQCVEQYCSEIRIGSDADDAIVYDVVVKLGDPVEEIVKLATAKSYDLIVVGRHGRSSLHEAIHRGTVRSILKGTSIPVFVVQLPE
jgi:nucleotide-binding universal stress UspA family protein